MIAILEVLVALDTLGDVGAAVSDINDMAFAIRADNDCCHAVLGICLGSLQLLEKSFGILVGVLCGCTALRLFLLGYSGELSLGRHKSGKLSCGSALRLFLGESCFLGGACCLFCHDLAENCCLRCLLFVGSLGIESCAFAVVILVFKGEESFLGSSSALFLLGSSSASLELLIRLERNDKGNPYALFIVRELFAVVKKS